ncbi:MAG: hypothetical protein ACP5PV_05925 [Methanothrix sp.]
MDAVDSPCTLNIDLPSQQVSDVAVVCQLPAGIVYQQDSLTISGAATSPVQSIEGSGEGTGPLLITWDFGDVDNTADQDINIEFRAVIADVSSNLDSTLLSPATAFLQYRDDQGVLQTSSVQSSSVEVVEPSLSVAQQLEPANAAGGNTVTSTISLFHSFASHADAYDAILASTIPPGLTYVPGSMETTFGPATAEDNSEPEKLVWQFDSIDQSWSEENKITLRYKATVDDSAQADTSPLTTASLLTWYSAPADLPESRSYSASTESSLALIASSPAFNITLAASPNPVPPEGDLTYTISYENKGGDAPGAYIQARYDSNTQFISADPAPDEGKTDRWTLGQNDVLPASASGTITVKLQVAPALENGTMLTGSATISSDSGISAQDTAFTRVQSGSTSTSLIIEKSASSEVIRPGGTLDYDISYQNAGTGAATNVTITDVVDANLEFDPATATPEPSLVWQEDDGTHVFWNASALGSESLEPGDSGSIRFQVSLPSEPQHPDYDWVYNDYKFDSDESQGQFQTLQTAVIHSLYIRKKAARQVYANGEMINYTLTYGNDLVVDLDHAVITDILPDAQHMEFVEADPVPTSVQGNILIWNIGTIPSKSNGTILLYAKTVYNRSTTNFFSSGSVSGQGYVNFNQRLDTAEKPHTLTNYANITANVADEQTVTESDSSSATIILSESFGTALDIIGHGSGSYSREEVSSLETKNKTISSKTSLAERYQESSFSLPAGRSISFSSKWSEAQRAKNRITGATMVERYMYADKIDRDSKILLDKNGSTLESQTSFQGAGHVGLLKQSAENTTKLYVVDGPARNRPAPTYESREDYLGSFNITTKFDESGKNVDSTRSASGFGYAASDKRIGHSQRSYESGTGSYSAEDQVQTATNYLAKDINLTYAPVEYRVTPTTAVQLSQKWSEGIWSQSGSCRPGSTKLWATNTTTAEPYTFIGERFSSADFLNKSTVASGLGQMKTSADFQGQAEFKVERNNNSADSTKPDVSLYEEYTGRYSLTRNVEFGVAKFNEPHLSLSKIGKAEPAGGSFVDYTITVTNDGNRALGPVYVQDLFPPGTEYVSSSLRPSTLNPDSARWTLLSLGIGASTTIDLKLNMTEELDSLINRVQADGSYADQFVTAQNYSSIQMNWLSCCQPQLLAAKEGYVSPENDRLVHYRILIKNRENEPMVATITDQLPEGMMFQNSSVSPADSHSDRIVWNIIDLLPGQAKIIDYWARALHGGTFINQAHVEAQYLNGTDSAWGDLSCRVYVGSGMDYSSSSDLHPPECFGLNCTLPLYGTGEEWIPCPNCGDSEFTSIEDICSSCAIS